MCRISCDRAVRHDGGPAGGNQAATHAARLGVDVTLVERDVVGDAATRWDCIPSKAMIATGGAMSHLKRIAGTGVAVTAGLRVADIVESILVHPALAEALVEAAE